MSHENVELGTVIRATHQPRDLIPAFLDRLSEFGIKMDKGWGNSDTTTELVIDLMDLLNEWAPPYCYFGAHYGDGSDFGFWPDHDSIEESIFDGTLLRVDDLSEIPDKYSGDVVYINCHHNVTMGVSRNGEFEASWSMV